MKQRNAQGQYAKAEHVSTEGLMAMLAGLDIKMLVTKFVIGYVFAVTAFVAAGDVAMTLALMTNIVWLQYVISFIALCALAYGVIRVTPWVADAVYDAGAWIGAKFSEFAKKNNDAIASARQRVSNLGKAMKFNNSEQHAAH